MFPDNNKSENGVSIRRKVFYTDTDINNVYDDNIYINTISIKGKKMIKYEDIKAALLDGSKTAEELAAMIVEYVSNSALEVETKLGTDIANEGLLLTSIINEIKKSPSYTDEFKEKCLRKIIEEMTPLEESLREIDKAGEEMEEVLKEAETKEAKLNKWMKVVNIGLAVTAVAVTAVVGFKLYRHFNPELVVLDMDSTDMLTDM